MFQSGSGSRYYASGGDLMHANGRRLPLRDAEAFVGDWGRKAIVADQNGCRPLARMIARDTLQLHAAMAECVRQRRAAGWRDPFAADAA